MYHIASVYTVIINFSPILTLSSGPTPPFSPSRTPTLPRPHSPPLPLNFNDEYLNGSDITPAANTDV